MLNLHLINFIPPKRANKSLTLHRFPWPCLHLTSFFKAIDKISITNLWQPGWPWPLSVVQGGK